MRKKAERKIRQAATLLGDADRYRIDRVRGHTDLIRKVFDKTILDMARLGTIELLEGDTDALEPAEIADLVRRGDQVFAFFRFATPSPEPVQREDILPETTTVILKGIDRDLWRRFEALCRSREGKMPAKKIEEMIRSYTTYD